MVCSTHHHELKNGVGKCSVPMWQMGVPAGFCDEPAYGKPPKPEYYWRDAYTGERKRSDGRYNGHVPALACPGHGGPKKEEAVNLCDFCKKEIPTCQSNPKFGTGKGNDNIYECDGYEERIGAENKEAVAQQTTAPGHHAA